MPLPAHLAQQESDRGPRAVSGDEIMSAMRRTEERRRRIMETGAPLRELNWLSPMDHIPPPSLDEEAHEWLRLFEQAGCKVIVSSGIAYHMPSGDSQTRGFALMDWLARAEKRQPGIMMRVDEIALGYDYLVQRRLLAGQDPADGVTPPRRRAGFAADIGVTPDFLKRELSKPGRSQSGLAAALGVDASSVNRMVNGTREIKARELPVIRAYLTETEAA